MLAGPIAYRSIRADSMHSHFSALLRIYRDGTGITGRSSRPTDSSTRPSAGAINYAGNTFAMRSREGVVQYPPLLSDGLRCNYATIYRTIFQGHRASEVITQ